MKIYREKFWYRRHFWLFLYLICIFLLILDYFLFKNYFLLIQISVPILIIVLFFYKIPYYSQGRKDKLFRSFFANRAIFIIPRIFKSIRWGKQLYTGYEIKNTRGLLPRFLMNVVENNNDFDILKFNIKGKYHYNRPHSLPKFFSRDFLKKKFDYEIIHYLFIYKKNLKLTLSASIITINEYSIICLTHPKNNRFKDLIEVGVRPIYLFALRFPWFSEYLFKFENEIRASKMAFNPFIVDTFGTNLKLSELINSYNQITEYYIQFPKIKEYISGNNYYFQTEAPFFLTDIKGEKTFFNTIFKWLFNIQSRSLTLFTDRNIILDETPLNKINNFYKIFNEFEYYIEDLNIELFTRFKDYILRGSVSLNQTYNIFTEFIDYLDINDPLETYLNLKYGLKVIEMRFSLIRQKIIYYLIKPTKVSKEVVNTGFKDLDFEIRKKLDYLDFFTIYSPELKNLNSWLESISFFGNLLNLSYKRKEIFRASAQSWSNEIKDMQPWFNILIGIRFGDRYKEEAQISDGKVEHWVDNIPIEDKLIRSNEKLIDKKIIEEKYQKHKN
ncbi:hypothetical protein LCGC14_1650440, partial [marine sediment metagenome]